MFAKNFRVAAAMKTSVLLSWEVPDSYKSAVPFKVGKGHSQPDHPTQAFCVLSVIPVPSPHVHVSVNWVLVVHIPCLAGPQ